MKKDPSVRPHTVRIELNDEQKQKLREQLGEDVESVEFSIDELEERVAPRIGHFM